MKVYLYFIVYVLVVGFLAHFNHSHMPQKEKYRLDEDTVFYKNQYGFWYLLLFAGFAFVACFRYNVGSDYWYYYAMNIDLEYVKEMFIAMDEPISLLLQYIGRQIWDVRLMNIVVTSLAMTILVFYGISQYDQNDISLVLLLYMFTGSWLFSFNGIRQALAASFIFAFSKKSEGKWWILKYALVVFIAFLIHRSALVLFPILVISQFKITKYQVGLITVCAFVIPRLFDWVYEFMDVDITNEYSLAYIAESINPIRIIVAFAPLALLILAVYKKEFIKQHYFVTNMTIFNALLTLTTADSAYLNRVTKYTAPFLIVFIPQCLKATTRNMRIVMTVIVVLLYAMFFFYEIRISDSLNNFQWVFQHIK